MNNRRTSENISYKIFHVEVINICYYLYYLQKPVFFIKYTHHQHFSNPCRIGDLILFYRKFHTNAEFKRNTRLAKKIALLVCKNLNIQNTNCQHIKKRRNIREYA